MNTEILNRELVTSEEKFEDLGLAVSVFGSARTTPQDDSYINTVAVSVALAKAGFGIITGGGGGAMEAANLGAQLGGGKSVGLTLELPFETVWNEHMDDIAEFKYFASRKCAFVRNSCAFVVTAGGIGTLDELAEVYCLMQTGKTPPRPIILFGSEFWKPFVDLIDHMIAHGTMSAKDRDLISITDDVDEVVELILNDNRIKF